MSNNVRSEQRERERVATVSLGDHCRDIVTGFRGLAIARLEHLFRAAEIKIEPERCGEDGKPAEGVWFEESRIERE